MKKQEKSFTENRKGATQRNSTKFDEKKKKPSFKKDEEPKKKYSASDKKYDKPKEGSYDDKAKRSASLFKKDDNTKKRFSSSDKNADKRSGASSFDKNKKRGSFKKTDKPPNSFDGNTKPRRSKASFDKKGFIKEEGILLTSPEPKFYEKRQRGPLIKEARPEREVKGAKKIILNKKSAVEFEPKKEEAPNENMRLNRYLAHAGIAARRKADMIIQKGEVTVNNIVVKEMGYRVAPTDVVKYKGKKIVPSRNFIYILLNKPKDFITTASDDKGRKTVMHLVEKTTDERIYPVGRLDRNTTGLLLLTNDGLLAQTLSHPSFEVRKIYHVSLNKPLTDAHFNELKMGVTLEDGVAKVNDIGYPDPADPMQVGVEIHIGKNRIVRRLFEHLGYTVEKLDRVMYAGLTKKDLPRGKHRILKPMEVLQLKKVGGS
ncbi:MAG: hypothetical protein RJA07_881 [Bacteroidota bacterium]|jgi:23S rRNA pseudouridine2605 synthase